MFCSNCGTEIPNGRAFCSNCGAAFGSDGLPETKKTPRMESISFAEKPERESTTIDMHQKMGWSLKSSQEIYTANSCTAKYIKLVFERDKNMPNYNILKEKYENYTKLVGQIALLEASVEKRPKKFYFFFAFLIPFVMSVFGVAVFLKMVVDEFFVFDFMMIALLTLFFVVCYVVSLGIVLPIATKIAENNVKRKTEPVVSELYEQMNDIVNDSERYL